MDNKSIQAVIFDMDGLLLDTEPLYQEANQAVCSRYGKDYAEHIRVQVIGKGELLGAKIIIDSLNIPLTPQEFLDARDVLLEEIFLKTKPMPGAVQLTHHLHKHGIPIAVATSSNSHAVKLKTNSFTEWFKVFNGNLVSGDHPNVKKGKPAPDIFLEAARTLNIDPSLCLVFEDSAAGVQAGKAAGMKVVAVPDPAVLEANKSSYQIADMIIQSLEHVQLELFNLPSLSS